MEEKNEILGVSDVMEKLKLSYRTVLNLIAKGTLPASKIANRWYIQPRDLIVMLEKEKATMLEDLRRNNAADETTSTLMGAFAKHYDEQIEAVKKA